MPRGKIGTFIAQDIKDTELAYIAGIIDGEGTVRMEQNLKYKYRYPRISVVQNTTEMLEYLKSRLGGSTELHQPAGTKVGKTNYMSNKDTYRWNTGGQNAYELLKKVVPYMIVKRDKTMQILKDYEEILSTRVDHRKRQGA